MASSKADRARRLRAVALAATLLPASALAQTLADCARLDADLERLACYDRLVGRPVTTATPAAPLTPAETAAGLPPAKKPAPVRIESRIVGPFEGWEGKTRFTLENGQVWENIGGGSLYHVAESPRVTITPGSFGSWFLSVEGSSVRTAVRRVR